MPGLVKLRKEHQGLQVIGWHVGKGGPKDVEGVVKAKGVDYPIVKTEGYDEVQAWGATKIPKLVVIDKKGKIRGTDLEPADGEKLALKLLKE